MQGAPAPAGDPFHKRVCAGLVRVHGAQQPAVGHPRGAPEHAPWVGRAVGDLVCGAARGRPRRRRRHQHVDDQSGKRQPDESPGERCPVVSVAQPQQPGDHVRQDEKRHVDGADDHLPPRRLGQLELFLQPHCGHHPKEHPPVHVYLGLPQSGRSHKSGRVAAEVVQQQKKRERQPIAHDGQSLAGTTDTCRDQPGGDVEQQQFAVEREPFRHRPVHHNGGPYRDCNASDEGEPPLARCDGSTTRGDRLPLACEHLDLSIGRY